MGKPASEPATEDEPQVADAPAAVKREPFQLRLSHLFLATFLVAVITMIAVSFGPGTLPWSIGMTLAWLNVRGFFRLIQQKQSRPRAFYAVWLLIVASLFLPAARGCNKNKIKGWQLAQFAAMAEAEAIHEFAIGTESAGISNGPGIVYLALINVANILVLLSPLFLWRLQAGKGRWMGSLLAIAAVAVWLVTWDSFSGFLIGYYVWAGGITLMFLTFRIGWRTFVAMALVAPPLWLIDAFS